MQSDYTVGWICPSSEDLLAAQVFLDEEHGGVKFGAQGDENCYTLGKIGKHKVVIAILPDVRTSSAAVVATNMRRSFPKVKIGLMVGTGSGAPSGKHDIRLGDIVVGAGEGGGVLQYGGSECTLPYRPPTVLKRAVDNLKARYEREGHQLEAAINTVLDENPRLQRKYKRPDLGSDRLYRSGVTHPPNDERDCANACGADPSKLILRPERNKDKGNAAIHCGLIASSDQLIEDSLLRDKLAGETGVLCFEIGGIGLMSCIPSLVIRGICDYSDTHKNTNWQKYAAMAAAAYAKDLLSVLEDLESMGPSAVYF